MGELSATIEYLTESAVTLDLLSLSLASTTYFLRLETNE